MLKAMILAMAREQAANETRLATAAAEIARLEAVEKNTNERIANSEIKSARSVDGDEGV